MSVAQASILLAGLHAFGLLMCLVRLAKGLGAGESRQSLLLVFWLAGVFAVSVCSLIWLWTIGAG